MGMRITTNGIFQGYRKDLANSYYKFSKSMSRVTTQRNFESYAEDVSAASRAFQLRRSHWRAENQITNSNYVISKFETAWSAIDYIVDGTGMEDNLNSIVEALRGLNSPTGSARIVLGESAVEKAESIVRLLNTQYGDQFIFAGEDGRNVPFTWETDEAGNTWLAYRGIDVSTPVGITEEDFANHIVAKYNPPETDTKVTNQALDSQGLQEIANKIGPEAGLSGPFSLTYDSGSDTFTLSETGGVSQTLTRDQVLGLLPDEDGATTYSYSFSEAEDGSLTLTTTATTVTKEENWEIGFDETLTKQGFELKLPDGFTNSFPTEEWARIELDKLIENDANVKAAFNDYVDQFNEKYESFAHGEEGATAYDNGRKLVAMSRETMYVDIGVGVQWGDTPAQDQKFPDLIPTSAYNAALNGLTFLGFGSEVGEDGELHSNNLVMLMYEIGSMLKSCDSVTGQYPEGWDTERVAALTRKIERSVSDVTVQHVKLANDTKYLQTNLAQLTAQRDNLNNQILDIEQIDPADAITEFMYARYSYNAALSVGNSILTNTLLDYLR